MEFFVAMLVLGLVTSVHCVSMCGPMVVTYALKGTEDGNLAAKLKPNLAYQGAKIASYMLVGLVLGAIGAALNLDVIRPYVMVGAGVFMLVLGLGMTGKVPWAAKLSPRPPAFLVKAMGSVRRKANENAAGNRSSLATPISFGLLTGLMPCAPLVAAQLNAAAAGSATAGALGMLAFGLGTAPLMLGFGTASSFIPPRFKQRATVVLALVVMVFGVTYLNRGAMLLGSPLTTQSLVSAVTGSQPASASNESFQLGADGVVEIPLVIENVRFVPNTLTIPAGQPVRLVVDRREDNGCSAQLAVPQLGVLVDLAPFATTTVVLPAAAEGTYTLTCGMGMMSGQIRAVASGSSGASAPAPALESSPAASDLAACACCAPAGSTTPVEGSAVLEGGVQRITVGTSNGYEPNIIKLAAGIPAEITFKAGSGCMAQVMSDDLGFFQDLTSGDQTIPLPPLSPGEYGFSCGMRMVFGTIVVE